MRIGTIRRSVARILLVTFVLALMLLPTACSESESISGTTVSLAVDRNIKQGDMFAVEVRISTDTACRGAQFELTFDPALMKCDEVVEGAFFKDWAAGNGGSTIVLPATIDNDDGHVSGMGIAVIGAGAGGVKGSGLLCSYHFTALADGTASPTLSGVVVSDVTGTAIPEVEVKN
ncbi:MAG: hypothetical protein JW753_01255 [Dehalococcoidia bacterium]|nr:hypothetical protein [Dehalococcoidia bacterium]